MLIRDRATRMALGESGTLGEAFVSYKNKTNMPPTPTDFDAIAEGFTLGALPEDFSTSKPTGTFLYTRRNGNCRNGRRCTKIN